MTKQILSYHLAESLFSYIYSSGQPIYKRVNLLAFAEKCAIAMLTNTARTKNKENISLLDQDLEHLRSWYEPALDSDQTVFEKRSVFEMYMDQVLLRLLDLISDNNLVDQRTISEVYATRWNNKKGTE